MDEDRSEALIERLITALASQVAASDRDSLAPGAVEALAELSRDETRAIFGIAGHLVHYGSGSYELEAFIASISSLQRSEAASDAAFVPGDTVRLIGELPRELDGCNYAWTYVVRYVGDDATADIQPPLIEDYLI